MMPNNEYSLVKVIIFSKNRPLQLDATLRSFMRHCKDFHQMSLHVIAKASDVHYGRAYSILEKDYSPFGNIFLIAEKDFRQQVLHLLANSEYVLWLVDDNIFVRDFSVADCRHLLEINPDAAGYSLRLGENTSYCYPHDKQQKIPDFEQISASTYKYQWTVAEYDFGYPLEVSSSLYRVRDLLPLLETINFFNPNSLEAGLAAHCSSFRGSLPFLLCPVKSVTFCNPVNKVQTTFEENRAANSFVYSAASLLESYLKGSRVHIELFDDFTPSACHQEALFNFCVCKDTVLPSVSVVIACYNYGHYLQEAIDSVINQTFQCFEIIIVNDGSTDNTREVAEASIATYTTHDIRLINQENSGHPAHTRNRGIMEARGNYILPLDADDKLHPLFLEVMLQALDKNPAASIAYCDTVRFGDQNDAFSNAGWDPQALRFCNFLNYCSLYRKSLWETLGGYKPCGYEDWEFWLNALEHGCHAIYVPMCLFYYRTKKGGRMEEELQPKDDEYKAQLVILHPSLYDKKQYNWSWSIIRALKS